MIAPLYALSIELAVGSLTNVTSFCDRLSFSRNIGDIFSGVQPDYATVELSNEVGSFSPILQTGLIPGRLMKLEATHREPAIVDFDWTTKQLGAQVGASVASLQLTRPGSAMYINNSGFYSCAGSGEARFTHDPLTLQCLGLLIEPSTITNFVLASDLVGIGGSNTLTATQSYALAPNGNTSATLLIVNSTTDPYCLNALALNGNNLTHTVYCHVQSGGSNPSSSVRLRAIFTGAASIDKSADYIFSTQTFANAASSLYNFGSDEGPAGFRRIWFSFTDVASAGSGEFRISPTITHSGGTCLAWGGGVVAGTSVPMHIATGSSAVTRPADQGVINNVASFFGTSGALAFDFMFSNGYVVNSGSFPRALSFTGSTSVNEELLIYGIGVTQDIGVDIRVGGSSTLNFNVSSTIISGMRYITAIAYGTNDAAALINGGVMPTDTSAVSAPSVYTLRLGYYDGALTSDRAAIVARRFRYVATRIDSAALNLWSQDNYSLPPESSLSTRDVTTYPLFSGRIKHLSTRPTFGERTTVIEAATEVDRMNRTLLNTGIFTGINAGSLFTEIMSRSSVQSFAADAMDDSVDFAWYRDRNASNAVEQLMRSGYYQVFTDGAGTVNLRGRYFGALGTPVNTVTEAYDLNYRLDDSKIINRVKVSATPRSQISDVSTVAYVAQPVLIPASASVGFFMSYFDPRNQIQTTPVGSIITLVSSQDYYAAQNSDGTGSDFTSTLSVSVNAFGESAVCSLFNGTGTDAYLTRFQIRGYPILSGAEYRPQFDDSSSQAVYGLTELAIEESLITDLSYLRDFTTLLVNERKEPRSGISLTRANEFPHILSDDVGDVLAIVNSVTGINSMWTIRSAQHDLDLTNGLNHRVTYDLEGYTERSWLILDHATFGQLDNGRQLGL